MLFQFTSPSVINCVYCSFAFVVLGWFPSALFGNAWSVSWVVRFLLSGVFSCLCWLLILASNVHVVPFPFNTSCAGLFK